MSRPDPAVDLVVPVLNEAHVLGKSVETMRAFLADRFPYPWRIVIAENGSKDGTIEVAERLAAKYDDVGCVLLGERGRGRALRVSWTRSQADIVAYTDVDISTELEALERLCRAIHEEGYDIAVGSRLSPDSEVMRGFKREFISRSYNVFIKAVLFTKFVDAQCGFKAVSRRVVDEIVPEVKDQAWFFDTELLVLAEKRGLSIKDVPVRWVDDDDSRVKIVSTAWEDIKGVLRLRRYLWSRDFRSYASMRRAGGERTA
jgi:glycosyltransferase involved in cell wall biosynthesis